MSFRRYEIFLPTRYNDGAPVEPEKHYQTAEELVARFHAVSYAPQAIRGVWVPEGTRDEEDRLRLFVDAGDTPVNTALFATWKEQLKVRFRQLDIWIVSYEIRLA